MSLEVHRSQTNSVKYHYFFYDSEVLVSKCGIMESNTFRLLIDFVVMNEHRNKGYGKKMLDWLIANDPPDKIFAQAKPGTIPQDKLVNLYSSYGYKWLGRVAGKDVLKRC